MKRHRTTRIHQVTAPVFRRRRVKDARRTGTESSSATHKQHTNSTRKTRKVRSLTSTNNCTSRFQRVKRTRPNSEAAKPNHLDSVLNVVWQIVFLHELADLRHFATKLLQELQRKPFRLDCETFPDDTFRKNTESTGEATAVTHDEQTAVETTENHDGRRIDLLF